MKYVALLRGINVGGNNRVSMKELKAAFEEMGHTEVLTYINSGNVIFSSDKKDKKSIVDELESMLTKKFHYTARVVVKSQDEIERIKSEIPKAWDTDPNIRCYVGFLSEYATDDDIKEIKLREDVDEMKVSKGVLLMTTQLSGLTKSGFSKMTAIRIYKEMTMRNYNTTKKIFALMGLV